MTRIVLFRVGFYFSKKQGRQLAGVLFFFRVVFLLCCFGLKEKKARVFVNKNTLLYWFCGIFITGHESPGARKLFSDLPAHTAICCASPQASTNTTHRVATFPWRVRRHAQALQDATHVAAICIALPSLIVHIVRRRLSIFRSGFSVTCNHRHKRGTVPHGAMHTTQPQFRTFRTGRNAADNRIKRMSRSTSFLHHHGHDHSPQGGE